MMFPTPKRDALRIQRARAIEFYARLEQNISDLASELLGVHPRLGGVVFFRITNSNSRDKILETLLKKNFSDTFRVYWHGDNRGNKGVFHHLRAVNQDRNRIVHWAETNIFEGKSREMPPGPETGEWVLMPPNWWDHDDSTPSLNAMELSNFVAKADFVRQSIFMFQAFQFHRYPPAEKSTVESWRGIFSQSCSYPPQESHPKFARWQVLASPPQT